VFDGSESGTKNLKILNPHNLFVNHTICSKDTTSVIVVASFTMSGYISQQPAEYHGQEDFFGGEPPLSRSVGYFVVLGFGAIFSIFTTIVVYLDQRMSGKKEMTSEHFK